jgi:hypothetical protein
LPLSDGALGGWVGAQPVSAPAGWGRPMPQVRVMAQAAHRRSPSPKATDRFIALVPIPERIRKSRRSAEGGLIFAEQVWKLDEPRARQRQTRQRESGGCLMVSPGLGWESTWTEDRATQRCDPSAVPGAETGAGAKHPFAPLPLSPLRDRHQSDKPSRQDAATDSAGEQWTRRSGKER